MKTGYEHKLMNEMAQNTSALRGRVTIGITTKDRWQDLKITVDEIVRLGLHELEFIVVDDGSVEARAEEILQPLLNCRIFRAEKSKGLVYQRNRIAELASTDYLVSLDDDSCVMDQLGLPEGVAYLDTHKEVAVVAMWSDESILCRNVTKGSFAVRSFLGGGHILRLSVFRELGGYRESLHYMCEEREYALRVYGRGLSVVLMTAVKMFHRRTPVARSSDRFWYYRSRNTLLCYLFNAPWQLVLPRVIRAVVGLAILSLRARVSLSLIVGGFIDAFREFVAERGTRTPLSRRQFRAWVKLPDF